MKVKLLKRIRRNAIIQKSSSGDHYRVCNRKTNQPMTGWYHKDIYDSLVWWCIKSTLSDIEYIRLKEKNRAKRNRNTHKIF
jgi:hypothetical protein